MESAWRPIRTAPHAFDADGTATPLLLRDVKTGQEWRGHRTFWAESGWCEIGSGRELRPTHWHAETSRDTPPQRPEAALSRAVARG